MRATGVAVLELGERYPVRAVALLATPGIAADEERLRLHAALDQLHAALPTLRSSTGLAHHGPSCAAHPPLPADSPWPGAPVLWLEPAR